MMSSMTPRRRGRRYRASEVYLLQGTELNQSTISDCREFEVPVVCSLSLRRLEHYSQMSDVQTLAMLCSVFRGQGIPQDYFALYGPRGSGFTLHHSRYVSTLTLHSLQ